MSEIAPQVSDPYRVQPGDTLSTIARGAGTSVQELQRLNGIAHANKLDVGQVLYLTPRSAFGVSILFLDALRYPVANLPYRVRFDGRTVSGATGDAGMVPRQTTRDARSAVEVWVQDAQAAWQQVHSTVSGFGHKLITLVSDAIVVKATTEAHPSGAPAVPAQLVRKTATATQQAASPPNPQGAPSKNNPAVKTKPKKGPQGQPIIEIGIEIPQGLLDLFAVFKGGEISEEDWQRTALALGCEREVLMAIAKVESGGRNAFWRLNRGDGAHIPAILYERHYFSDLTGHKYDEAHSDVS